MASRDKGLHFQPPCPQRVPTLTSGDHRHGAAGYLQFQGYARFPFRFQQSCSGSLLWSGLSASCAAALSHTHTRKTGQVIKTSSLPYLGTFSHQGPLHISPKFKPSVPRDKSPHRWHTRKAAHPHNVAAAGRRPAFYRKDIVSHILPCPQHRLKTVDPGPSPERNKPHRLLHRHVPGGARLPTQGGAPAQY